MAKQELGVIKISMSITAKRPRGSRDDVRFPDFLWAIYCDRGIFPFALRQSDIAARFAHGRRYMVTGSTGMNNGNPIPRDQMIHDMFCNNLIAAGIQCPALDTPKFQFTCVDPAVTPCNGGGPTSTVMLTVRVSNRRCFRFSRAFFLKVVFPCNSAPHGRMSRSHHPHSNT